VGAACGAALGKGGGASSFLHAKSERPTNMEVSAKLHCTDRFIGSSRQDYLTALLGNLEDAVRHGQESQISKHQRPFVPSADPPTAADGPKSPIATSTAAHGIATVQTFVAGTIAHRDVPTSIANRGIAHHLIKLCIECSAASGYGFGCSRCCTLRCGK